MYQYDSLNRLASASAYTFSGTPSITCAETGGTSTWAQSFTYDGFGNLTDKNETAAPMLHVLVNGTTNQISSANGAAYDSNGNMTSYPTGTYLYDAENRMNYATSMSSVVNYGYDSQNKRTWVWSGSNDTNGNATNYTVAFYGVNGQRLGRYGVTVNQLYSYSVPHLLSGGTTDTYFVSRRLLAQDRLGSANGKFYPYGEDKPGNPGNDMWKFGTYWRDAVTGLDYADQRFYNSAIGRFMSADPYQATVTSPSDPTSPQSWNRFTYVQNDPVNSADRRGLEREVCDEFVANDCCDDYDFCDDGGGGGGGASPPPPPKCWQNTGRIHDTLFNLGTDIEADVVKQFISVDLQLLTDDIKSDIGSEALAIGGGTTASPFYIGGHFNLNLTADQISQFSSTDQAIFARDFAPDGQRDGIRQAASTGLAAALGHSLHSQVGKQDPGILPGEYSFHFDRFNGKNFPIGTIGHGLYDVLGGHLGNPCLDPAWHH